MEKIVFHVNSNEKSYYNEHFAGSPRNFWSLWDVGEISQGQFLTIIFIARQVFGPTKQWRKVPHFLRTSFIQQINKHTCEVVVKRKTFGDPSFGCQWHVAFIAIKKEFIFNINLLYLRMSSYLEDGIVRMYTYMIHPPYQRNLHFLPIEWTRKLTISPNIHELLFRERKR